MSPRFVRASGLVLVLASILSIIGFVIHPAAETDILNATWMPSHLLLLLGFTFALFGLIGLYADIAHPTRRPGLAGFVLLFLATSLWAGVFFSATFIAPAVAASAPQALAAIDAALALPILFLVLLLFLGSLLFGAALLRARVLSRWGAVLLILGGIGLLLGFLAAAPEKIVDAAGALLSLGELGLGMSVRKAIPAALRATS